MKLTIIQIKIAIFISALIAFYVIRKSFVEPVSLGRGGPTREERIISGAKEINDFKKSNKGKDIRNFRRKLNRMVRIFELNNDVHVLRSSVLPDGPIIVQ